MNEDIEDVWRCYLLDALVWKLRWDALKRFLRNDLVRSSLAGPSLPILEILWGFLVYGEIDQNFVQAFVRRTCNEILKQVFACRSWSIRGACLQSQCAVFVAFAAFVHILIWFALDSRLHRCSSLPKVAADIALRLVTKISTCCCSSGQL